MVPPDSLLAVTVAGAGTGVAVGSGGIGVAVGSGGIGVAVGSRIGVAVGASVGVLVGAGVGVFVGSGVGVLVGSGVGVLDGSGVGVAVGSAVGGSVGTREGSVATVGSLAANNSSSDSFMGRDLSVYSYEMFVSRFRRLLPATAISKRMTTAPATVNGMGKAIFFGGLGGASL